MNMQNLTQKSAEAINEAVNVAKEYGSARFPRNMFFRLF